MMRPAGREARVFLAGICRMFVALAAIAVPIGAQAVPIDLNQFYSDPGAPIVVAADGSSATFHEDPSIFIAFLSNVPGFGDPTLLLPAAGATFSFDYNFVEAADNADIFHFALLDGLDGNPLSAYELLLTGSASGTATFDLSALVETVIGMQFELLPDLFADAGFDSVLTISNLRLTPREEPPPGSVPEPSTGALVLLALALTAIGYRLRSR